MLGQRGVMNTRRQQEYERRSNETENPKKKKKITNKTKTKYLNKQFLNKKKKAN